MDDYEIVSRLVKSLILMIFSTKCECLTKPHLTPVLPTPSDKQAPFRAKKKLLNSLLSSVAKNVMYAAPFILMIAVMQNEYQLHVCD